MGASITEDEGSLGGPGAIAGPLALFVTCVSRFWYDIEIG